MLRLSAFAWRVVLSVFASESGIASSRAHRKPHHQRHQQTDRRQRTRNNADVKPRRPTRSRWQTIALLRVTVGRNLGVRTRRCWRRWRWCWKVFRHAVKFSRDALLTRRWLPIATRNKNAYDVRKITPNRPFKRPILQYDKRRYTACISLQSIVRRGFGRSHGASAAKYCNSGI